jgi:ketosteroid isomerase-like protein
MNLADIVQRGWEAVGAGDFDSLVSDYVEDMKFIMPGQGDVLEGRQAFRKALDSLGEILPPGFEITGLRQIEGGNEVVSIVEWKSESSPFCLNSRVTKSMRNDGSSIPTNGRAHSKVFS